jgi:hypothetical protein
VLSTTSMLYANLLQAHDSHLYGATRSCPFRSTTSG